MYAVALAILVPGLLCLHLSARAAQTDYATLEKQLAAVESDLSKLEEIAGRYHTKEAELTLHLVAIRRERTEIQRNYAEYKNLMHSMGFMIHDFNPIRIKKIKSTLNQTQKQTKKLRSALAAWNQQVQQARQTQDEICANKARIDSGSPRQIAQWNESGSRSLETHTTHLREKREVLTAAWNGLNFVSFDLEFQLNRLKGFLLKNKEEYMTTFSRMKVLADSSKVTCGELEKDLAKAIELQNELKKLMKEASFLSITGRGDLNAQIDSALAKLKSMNLSPVPKIPEIPELDSQCKTFIEVSGKADSAKWRANIQQAESIAADARTTLALARAALKEASSAQAGFGGLGKARDCLAVLRQAQADAEKTDVDEVLSLVEGLQTRLEKAERQEHIFVTRNQENQVRTEEMKNLVKDARLISKDWRQMMEGLDEPLDPLRPDQAIQDFEKLLSGLTLQMKKLKDAAGELTKAIQVTEQKRRSACDRVVKAGSVPLPSSAELKAWHKEANSDIDRMRKTLEAASKKVQVNTGFVVEQAQKVTTSRDELSAVENKLFSRLNIAHHLIGTVGEAQENVKKATEIWDQVTKEGKALERLRKANLKELKRIQVIAAELSQRLLNDAAIDELKTIEARAAALAGRYPQSTMTDEPDRPNFNIMIVAADWKKLKPIRDTIERQISKIKALIKKAGTALEQAKSVQEASARDRSLFPDILAKADKCVGELATKLSAGRKLEAELRTMVDKANALFQECRYNKVMPILREALAKARSEKHKKSIKKKIKLTERRHKYEKTTITLFNDANALFKKGKYREALAKLKQAQKHTRCERFKVSLGRKIETVKNQIDSGGSEGQERVEERERVGDCARFVAQLRDQAEEILRLARQFSGIQSTCNQIPRSDRSRYDNCHDKLGRSACQTEEASKVFDTIWMQAKTAGCLEATRIKNPMGINAAIKLRCWRWKDRHGTNPDKKKHSCSIVIHNDYHELINGKPSPWVTLSIDSGNSKTIHIARKDGPWYRNNCRGAFCGLVPICGGTGEMGIKGGHPCTLAEMKAMANKECNKWEQQHKEFPR